MYQASGVWRSGHVQTIYPSLCRRVTDVAYRRERLELPDGDFIDIDKSELGYSQLVVILHGLEGSTDRAYVRGMVRAVNRAHMDAVAMNFRGCSGEINRLPRFYHSGDTEDLRFLLKYLVHDGRYQDLYLVGFSMGGNVILKFLGEEGSKVDPRIRRAVVFSVPCHLASSAEKLSRWENRIYMNRFLKLLREKIVQKALSVPGALSDAGYRTIRTFKDFDDRYTAKLHGFEDAADYWNKSSSVFFLHRIAMPTLLVNSEDDPFLGPPCYPIEQAREHHWLTLEVTRWGGHVGFVERGLTYWSEKRTIEFLQENQHR